MNNFFISVNLFGMDSIKLTWLKVHAKCFDLPFLLPTGSGLAETFSAAQLCFTSPKV